MSNVSYKVDDVIVAIVGGVFTLGFLFLVVALAIYLGNILSSAILGLVVVAGIIFLLCIIFLLFKKKIDSQIIKMFHKKFFKI